MNDRSPPKEVEPLPDLAASADDVVAQLDQLAGGLTAGEREVARIAAAMVMQLIPGVIRDRPDNLRLAELETWRKDLDLWKQRLTGADDRNGRLGRLDQSIATLHEERRAADAALRADLGTPEQRDRERKAAETVIGVRRWLYGIATAAVLGLGSGGWALYKADRTARDAAAASAARIDARIDANDKNIDHLFVLCGPGAASLSPPRTPP